MVKTASTTTNGATKKKSLFGKIFKKKSKKKSQTEEQEERKVEIVIENVQVEETREEEEGIPRDPTATSPRPTTTTDVASPRDAEEALEESANPDDREPVTEERDAADDILADLQHEEANPTPAPQQGWFGNWLDGMTHMCGPPQDQGLPTILSGEEMDMDAITNGETVSVMSPTSTVNSEAADAAPMSPEAAAPKVEEGEPELNQNKKQAEPEEETKKEEPKEEINTEEAGPTELTTAELSPRHPVDAPTSPKSLVVSPRGATKVEEVEEVAKILESPKEAEEPKEDEDNNTVGDSTVGDNTLIASPQKEEAAEPAGAKMDIFAQFTACCNPVAAPSMDETEGVKAGEDAASIKEEEEGGPQEPDGDKEDETKSVHQDAQSVVEEKKEGEPTTPKDAPEQERIVGTIHKEKKNTKMGLSLKNSTMYQGVFIAKIKAGSLFSKTDLREGMQVLEIQGKPCPIALEEAVNMLRHAVGDLEIVAQKPKCEI